MEGFGEVKAAESLIFLIKSKLHSHSLQLLSTFQRLMHWNIAFKQQANSSSLRPLIPRCVLAHLKLNQIISSTGFSCFLNRMELDLHRGLSFPGVFTKEIFLLSLGKRFYGQPIQRELREFTYTLLKDSKNKEHLPYPAMFWACSKCSKRSDTGMHHMCIGVPCFLLSFGKVYFLYASMYWACSRRSDTWMHHMCIGVPCFLLSFLKCIFYLLPCMGLF